MDTFTSQAMLAEANALRRRAKADRHDASVPLAVFGGTVLLGAAVAAAFSLLTLAYWPLAVPTALLLTWWLYRRQAAKIGIDPQGRIYLLAGICVPAAVLLIAGPLACLLLCLPLAFFPLPAIAVTLVVIGLLQHSRYLWISGVAFGAATLAAMWKDLLYAWDAFPIGLFTLATSQLLEDINGQRYYVWVYAVLGVLLSVLAVLARLRENRLG